VPDERDDVKEKVRIWLLSHWEFVATNFATQAASRLNIGPSDGHRCPGHEPSLHFGYRVGRGRE
jgi:hypothetical protein